MDDFDVIIAKFLEINDKTNEFVRLMRTYPCVKQNFERYYVDEAKHKSDELDTIRQIATKNHFENTEKLHNKYEKYLSRALETQCEYKILEKTT
jgi:hypothetical protein